MAEPVGQFIEEEVFPIPGLSNYFAAKSGNIYSGKVGGLKKMKPAILMSRGKTSYATVCLALGDGKYKNMYVHRLIAMTFLGLTSNDKRVINHKNLNKLDNCIENLEVVTHKQNTQHFIDTGHKPSGKPVEDILQDVKSRPWGQVNHQMVNDECYKAVGVPVEYKYVSKDRSLTLKENWQSWCRLLKAIESGMSSTSIAKEMNLSLSMVSRVRAGERCKAAIKLYHQYKDFLNADFLLPIETGSYPTILPVRFVPQFKKLLSDFNEGEALFGSGDKETVLAHLLLKGWSK